MATSKVGVNGRENCSVCLEPFRGRQPKLLPCFHTFCLPCLSRLADERQQAQQSSVSGVQILDGDGDKATVTISCPTCRQFIPVPPGGVQDFQTNFYLECSDEAVFTYAVLCDLCNGDEEAQYQCTQCHSSFCIHCRPYHSSTCGGTQVTALHSTSGNSGQVTALQSTSGQVTALQSTSGQVTALQSTSGQFTAPQSTSSNSWQATALQSTSGQVTALQSTSGQFTALQSTSGQVTAPQSTSGQVTALQSASGRGGPVQGPAGSQGLQQQVKMVEDCLQKLREDKDKLVHNREAMEKDVRLHYATVLDIVSDAKHSLVSSLRQVCDDLHQQLDTHMTEAQQTLDTLHQQVSGSQGPPVSPQAQHRAALFVQGDLQTILHNSSSSTASLLRHKTDDNAALLTDCLQSFMGKVVKSSQDTDSTWIKEAAPCFEPSGVCSGQAAPSWPHSADPTAWEELCQKVTALTSQVSCLQASNASLSQQVTALTTAHSSLSSEHSSLQREVSSFRDKSSRLTSDQAAVHRELTALKDKNSIVHQDLAVQNAERDNLRAQLDTLHNQVVTVQAQCSALKADINKDVDHLKTECSALKFDVKKNVDKLKSDLSGIQSNIYGVKRDHSTLQMDLKSTQKFLQDKSKEIIALETRLVKASSQVAFVARLDKAVTTDRKQQTLICDTVISSVGGGYNKNTGVFTALVPGTYCFMVNTGACKSDTSKQARLDIVLENRLVGYVLTSGNTMSTGHAAVKMTAGQRVWLRTYGDGGYHYNAGWWTYFSGMLLQPDV